MVRSNEEWPSAASATVFDCITTPLSSRIVTPMLGAACVETFAIATPVTKPDVLSKGRINEPGLRLSMGTTASCWPLGTVWRKTAKPVMFPVVSSCAEPTWVTWASGPVLSMMSVAPGPSVRSSVVTGVCGTEEV